MASGSKSETDREIFFEKLRSFPPVINGRINIIKFLEASSDMVSLVERLGTVFLPVKYDMQGNIDKIRKTYQYDESSCLLELMLDETSKGKFGATEGVLWLNRALHLFELIFQEVLICLQSNNYNVSMKKIFTVSYENSIKKYHNWVTQQLFVLVCKMSPALPQLMKAIDVNDDFRSFETRLTNFNITLHIIRCKIDDFFKEYNLLQVQDNFK